MTQLHFYVETLAGNVYLYTVQAITTILPRETTRRCSITFHTELHMHLARELQR